MNGNHIMNVESSFRIKNAGEVLLLTSLSSSPNLFETEVALLKAFQFPLSFLFHLLLSLGKLDETRQEGSTASVLQ